MVLKCQINPSYFDQVRFTTHQCGGEMSEEGVIQSPVHPNRYFHNTNCTWVVTAPSGKVVEIK